MDDKPDRSVYFKQRPDVRDFVEHVTERLAMMVFVVYLFWVASLSVRQLFIFVPAGIAYMAALIVVVRRRAKSPRKRGARGRRYKFMDIEHQSGWITFFAYLAMIGGGLLLFWLWVSGNLMRQWWLAVPATIVMLAGGIFSPDKEDIGGEGAAG
jgi:hypothetical protein